MQNKFLQALIYAILAIVLIVFLLVQPFNLYCKITKKCYPVRLSSFSISKKGNEKITINFNSKIGDELKDIVEFYPIKKQVIKSSNEYIDNSYFVIHIFTRFSTQHIM